MTRRMWWGRREARVITWATIASIALGAPARAAAQTNQAKRVKIFVPAFDGPKSLGVNVATILELQVWQTLRKAPTPNPAGLSFGDGFVDGNTTPLPSATHDAALQTARAQASDMTLWGQASPYGDGVVVQSYLTMIDEQPPLWEVKEPRGGDAPPIQIRAPRFRYDFRPIVLDRAIIDRYQEAGALKLYASPGSTTPIGSMGDYAKAISQDGNAAYVEAQGGRGWIKLPMLSSSRSEVVDFVGGVIRAFRGDWSGAETLFDSVISNPRTPTTLRGDAYIYRGVARARMGRDGTPDFAKAYASNPYDRAAAAYLLLSRIAAVDKTGDARAIDEAQRVLDANRYLFAANDPWLKRCTDAIEKVRASQGSRGLSKSNKNSLTSTPTQPNGRP